MFLHPLGRYYPCSYYPTLDSPKLISSIETAQTKIYTIRQAITLEFCNDNKILCRKLARARGPNLPRLGLVMTARSL